MVFAYDSLMLLPVTGSTGGKTNKTVVSEIYDSDMMSAVQPNQLGSTHFRSGNFFRPWRQLTIMGRPYERSRVTTEAEMMALKALGGVSLRRGREYSVEDLP